MVGGIHGGDESNTIYLTDRLITYFSKKPDAVPSNATLFILRSLNPDGEALPHKKEGRSNANLVDLNRSFPDDWSAEWSREGCWDLMELNAGKYPASEPETVALMAFVLENELVDICTCGVHTAAQVKENFSASWTKLTPGARERLGVAARTPCTERSHAWLEDGWLYA